MWPFSRKQETSGTWTTETLAVAEAPKAPEQKKKEIVCPPFGAHVAGLTRFGNTWMNLNEVSVIEFNPPDGCGAECYFKNQQGDWHIPDEDALAIRTYLESFEQIANQVDSAKTE